MLARGVVVFTTPLGRDDEVRGDLQEPLEQVGEGLRWRVLEGQDFGVVIVQAKMIAVALQRLVAQEIVEEDVVLESGRVVIST